MSQKCRIYPNHLSNALRRDRGRRAEILLYDELAKLDAGWVVFYGIPLLGPLQPGKLPQDGETDFIVIHPDHGLLIVEVKGGKVRFAGDRQQWISRDAQGNDHDVDPFGQGRKNKYALITLLKSRAPTLKHYKLPVYYAAAFPDVQRPQTTFTSLPPEEMIIGGDDLPSVADRLLEIFDFHRGIGSAAWVDGPYVVAEIEALLAPFVELRYLPRIGMAAEQQEVIRLTVEQTRALQMFTQFPRVAISGVAGSGKTLLAIEQCRRATREGRRTLFLCYNRRLAAFARREIAHDLRHSMEKVKVASYHDMATEWGLRTGQAVVDPQPFGVGFESYYEETLPSFFDKAIKLLPQERFDTIVVDEGQDFIDAYWITIEDLLADREHSRYIMFYDENQRIFTRLHDYPIPLPHPMLPINCRNTQRIHETAMRFRQGGPVLECPGPIGRTPETEPIKASDELGALRRVIHRLTAVENFAPRDIVVLSMCLHRLSGLEEGEQLGNYRLTWEKTLEGTNNNTIRCSSIYSFKGMEAPVVILAEVDRADKAIRDALLYSAISRAQHHLVVLGGLPVPAAH